MQHARDIADALGGIPALAKVCEVQYRLAYGYVDRNSIPAVHDLKIDRALRAVGSKITLHDIAKWRAASVEGGDSDYQFEPQKVSAPSTCGEQITTKGAA